MIDGEEFRTIDAGDTGPDENTKPRKRESRADIEARETAIFWHNVLADPVGRRELYRIICGAGHSFETRFVTSNGLPNPEATWHARGEQDFALRLYHEFMRRDPAAAVQMLLEHDPRFASPEPKRAGSVIHG